MRYVPDTSAIIAGILSERINSKEIKEAEIFVHNAVLAELESQANHGREVGFLGLTELKKLFEIGKGNENIKLSYLGERPKEFEIKYAKSGEIDSMIRNLALEKDAVFITLDKVDAESAEAQGIKVMFIETEELVEKKMLFEKFFDKNTMSVHLKEGILPSAKKGFPGRWNLINIGTKKMDKEERGEKMGG